MCSIIDALLKKSCGNPSTAIQKKVYAFLLVHKSHVSLLFSPVACENVSGGSLGLETWAVASQGGQFTLRPADRGHIKHSALVATVASPLSLYSMTDYDIVSCYRPAGPTCY